MKTSDIYEQVTNRIITQLEQGIAPWKSPYFSKVGFPRNFSTGKAYQGINVFLLGSHRFTSPYFLTFIQAKELGGHVRKGECGSLVVKYGTYTKQDEDTPAQNEDEAETRRFLKGYTVFHASQIDGIEFPAPENLPELSLTEKTDRAREIIAGMPNPPQIRYGSAIPCYRPATDSVHMPERGFFENEEALFSTLFHELAHSTGHASRLARASLLENKGIDAEGYTARKVYAEEELVAEMSASFLNAHAGIIEDDLANSAAYLQSWINALKSKDAKGWIIRAASQAQKAANYILNIQPEVQS
ncbi:MAG: ArdC-like ssDNA-binding domain-containing protein [Prosthecobacter sp.]|nr:ArdC-like ssDNA-binding domain-containing protein [Prosthecobacter sp.]